MSTNDNLLPERKATNDALERERERADDTVERPLVSMERVVDFVRNERQVADAAVLVERERYDRQVAHLNEQQRELAHVRAAQREASVAIQRDEADALVDEKRKQADEVLSSEGSALEPLTRARRATDERLQEERGKSDAISVSERQAREDAEQLLDNAVEFHRGTGDGKQSAA